MRLRDATGLSMATLCCLFLLSLTQPASAAESKPDCPVTLDTPFPGWQPVDTGERPDWYALYTACLPKLENKLAGRWPLILWQGAAEQPLSARQVHELLSRGVVQHVALDRQAIPLAQALQAAAAPVIVMQPKGIKWPYELLDDQAWRLSVDDPRRLRGWARLQVDPTRLDAWELGAAQVRGDLQAFKDAGVGVDAVWLDYEPAVVLADLKTVRETAGLSAAIPADALADEASFARYRRRLSLQLMSDYLAAPIQEVFPDASSTNWLVALSTPQVPVLSWDNWQHPQMLTNFSATNPIAYGIDTALLAVAKSNPPADQAELDRLYMHILLRQVSADAWNRHQLAPELESVPWVARRVVDEAVETPAMSRAAYREALRHLWLRDIDAMMVFNSAGRKNRHWRKALAEAQDVQHAFNEMLAVGDLLKSGRVMNYQVPMPGEAGVLWSGLRDDARAVVRLVRLGGSRKWLRLEVWQGEHVLLPLSDSGASFLLTRGEGGIAVNPL